MTKTGEKYLTIFVLNLIRLWN